MTRPLNFTKPAISYTIPELALATGIGETKIREAIDAQELEKHHFGRSVVVLADDAVEWIRSLPSERISA